MRILTFSKASSVFSGLAFRAWEASMMGMGMKRMVKFLMDTQPEDIIPQLVHVVEEGKEAETPIEMYRLGGKHGISINMKESDAFEHMQIVLMQHDAQFRVCIFTHCSTIVNI